MTVPVCMHTIAECYEDICFLTWAWSSFGGQSSNRRHSSKSPPETWAARRSSYCSSLYPERRRM